jgi:peptide/nickel transport system permease protein
MVHLDDHALARRRRRHGGDLRAPASRQHGLRSAINPIVTVLGVDIAVLLGSSVLVETVFDIPGIGRLNYVAITHSDFPITQGTVLFAAMFVILANIIVDIAYAYLDPRVRYS